MGEDSAARVDRPGFHVETVSPGLPDRDPAAAEVDEYLTGCTDLVRTVRGRKGRRKKRDGAAAVLTS